MPRRKKKYTTPLETAPTAMPQPSITPRFLGVREASLYAGFRTPISFWRWAKEFPKVIHPDKTTKPWRYDRLEIDEAFALVSGKKAA